MSTLSDIAAADFRENSARFRRYWSQSSLPVAERLKNRPEPKAMRRDRVATRLLRLTVERLVNLNLIRAMEKGA